MKGARWRQATFAEDYYLLNGAGCVNWNAECLAGWTTAGCSYTFPRRPDPPAIPKR